MSEVYDYALFGAVPAVPLPPSVVLAAWRLRRGLYPLPESALSHLGWCDAERRPASQATATGIGWTLRGDAP